MKLHEQIKNLKEQERARRQLRTCGTAAEATLWKMLKNKQIAGIRFRRQFSIGPFIVDFYSPQLNLVVELDGMVHFTPEAMEYDEQRAEYIQGTTGATILRFENKVVFDNPEIIFNAIEDIKNSMNPNTPQ